MTDCFHCVVDFADSLN